MLIHVNAKDLKETTVNEYVSRFLFGGCMTVGAGLMATRFGPLVGGLLLAFPAILPASVTLVEKHERKHKQRLQLRGWQRGTMAAGADAAGASIGSIGLAAFAAILSMKLPTGNPSVWLPVALAVWAAVNAVCWLAWKRRSRLRRVILSSSFRISR